MTAFAQLETYTSISKVTATSNIVLNLGLQHWTNLLTQSKEASMVAADSSQPPFYWIGFFREPGPTQSGLVIHLDKPIG